MFLTFKSRSALQIGSVCALNLLSEMMSPLKSDKSGFVLIP